MTSARPPRLTRHKRLCGVLALLVTFTGCAMEPPANDDDAKEEAATLTNEGKADLLPGDLCASRGWYGDGDCDWFCESPDPDCAPPAIGPDPDGDPTRYPVLFHHGFAGGHSFIFAWRGVSEALSADGHVVALTEVPPFDAIEVRAGHLAAQIDDVLARTGTAKVNIIAHSLGGLDARYLISTLGYGDRVASLTTISTPHRGTYVADTALHIPEGADRGLNAFFALVADAINDNPASTNVRAALTDLAEANADAFNEANPDDPRVVYESWAGVSSYLGLGRHRDRSDVWESCQGRLHIPEGTFDRIRPEFYLIAPIVQHGIQKRPNDGLVTVESSRHGNFRGCIPADHSEEVGQYVLGDGPNRDTGFDHVRFYRNIAYELAERGL